MSQVLCSLAFKIAHDFSHNVNLKLYYYCKMKNFSGLLDVPFSPHTCVAWLHSQIPADCDAPPPLSSFPQDPIPPSEALQAGA